MDSTIAGKMMFVSDNWHHWNDKDLLKAVYEEEEEDNNEGEDWLLIEVKKELQVWIRLRKKKWSVTNKEQPVCDKKTNNKNPRKKRKIRK